MHVMDAAPTQGSLHQIILLGPLFIIRSAPAQGGYAHLATNSEKDQLRGWAFCAMGKNIWELRREFVLVCFLQGVSCAR